MSHAPRRAMTLIELLVVIGILALLAALTAYFMPGMWSRQRAAAGASQLQSWLMTARQQAVRDRAPRGIRLLPDKADPTGTGMLLISAVYIQQPDDFTGGLLDRSSADPLAPFAPDLILEFSGVDFWGGYSNSAQDRELWPVQPLDYIELGGGGVVYRIADIPQRTMLRLTAPLAQPLTMPTAHYRIVRTPRTQGAETLNLPDGIAVDLNTFQLNGMLTWMPSCNRDTAGNILSLDILFGANGAVLGNVTADRTLLWVRDTQMETIFAGDPSIVTVYNRSGLVAAYDVALPPLTPYANVK